MIGALLLYAFFDIGGGEKWFWVDLFSPRYASDGATCPQNETMVFSPARPRTIIFHANLSPNMCHGRRSGLLQYLRSVGLHQLSHLHYIGPSSIDVI
jgi:hypothetical protein